MLAQRERRVVARDILLFERHERRTMLSRAFSCITPRICKPDVPMDLSGPDLAALVLTDIRRIWRNKVDGNDDGDGGGGGDDE